VTTLLLDADIIAFKLAATSQTSFAFPGCEPSVEVDDWEEVVPRIDAAIADLKDRLHTDKVIVCLSCPTVENFRLDVLPTYKGNRAETVRPVLLQPIKDYMGANYPSYRRPRLEADDIMGILSTHPKLVPGKKIIVSEDKDMKTIPGWLFNPAKDFKPRMVTLEEANRFHLYQTIIGDTTDGYTGCPGIGPVKGEWFLSSPELGASWEAVEAAYWSKGLTWEDALVQARVASICRSCNYDFKKKEVILWTPDSVHRQEAVTA
jgi:5'-3' exonuclease